MFKDIFNKEIIYTPFSGGVHIKNNLWAIFLLIAGGLLEIKKKGIPSLNNQRAFVMNCFFITNVFLSFFIYSSWGAGYWIDIRSFTLPLIILIFSFLSNLAKDLNEKKTITILLIIFFLIVLYRVRNNKVTIDNAWNLDRETAKCIERSKNERNWEYGIADFWWATKLNSIGNYKFRLLPVNNAYYLHDLSINKAIGDYRFNNNKSIDYVFCGKKEEREYVEEILGSPDEIIECEENRYLLYYKNNKIR